MFLFVNKILPTTRFDHTYVCTLYQTVYKKYGGKSIVHRNGHQLLRKKNFVIQIANTTKLCPHPQNFPASLNIIAGIPASWQNASRCVYSRVAVFIDGLILQSSRGG